MMRKARKEVENDNMEAYEKKAAEFDKKEKKEPTPGGGKGDDWFDNLKTFGT